MITLSLPLPVPLLPLLPPTTTTSTTKVHPHMAQEVSCVVEIMTTKVTGRILCQDVVNALVKTVFLKDPSS